MSVKDGKNGTLSLTIISNDNDDDDDDESRLFLLVLKGNSVDFTHKVFL